MHFKKLKIGGKHGGEIKGKGKDEVGKFKIYGFFNPATGDVKFKKEYKGKHTAEYHGRWCGQQITG